MTGQPDFYLPTREPLLPAGAHGAANNADLELGWSYEPATSAVGNEILYNWAGVNVGNATVRLGYFDGELFATIRISGAY